MTSFFAGALFLISFGSAILLTGGLVSLVFVDTTGTDAADSAEKFNSEVLTSLAWACTVASGTWLVWRIKRRALFVVLLAAMVSVVSVAGMEIAARAVLPPWPASALHGVPPALQRTLMTESERLDVSSRRNDWGQRDRDRTRRAAAGVMRIAFIGDSFLEEGVGPALSVVTEQQLDRSDVDVVNLGVSATAPDEYFYRVAQVALPLESAGCVVFVYLGNDLAADHRTLPGWLGIAAVSPRPSFLTAIGLSGLNSAVTGRERPVLRIWSEAGGLGESERRLQQRCRVGSDDEIAELLIRNAELPFPLAAQLRPKLQQPEMAAFYQMLREPDADRFRSYFFFDGTWLKATGMTPGILSDPSSTLYWIHATAKVCARRQCRLLVVLVPEGFAVDPRLQEQWSPLADMRKLTEKTSRAGRRMELDLAQAGIEVLNLTGPLTGIRGTYLNLDGHWSPLGVQHAAAAVAPYLRRWLDEGSSRAISP